MPAVASAPVVRAPLPAAPETPAPSSQPRQWAWLLAGAVIAFLVPFVLVDLLSIDRDL
jgi:hypothetical protein